MKSTKVISRLVKEQKWDDFMLFALGEETSDLFDSWIKNKEHQPFVEELIKNIPDKCLSPLLLKFSSFIIPHLINNYKESYATIALNKQIMKKKKKKNYFLYLIQK